MTTIITIVVVFAIGWIPSALMSATEEARNNARKLSGAGDDLVKMRFNGLSGLLFLNYWGNYLPGLILASALAGTPTWVAMSVSFLFGVVAWLFGEVKAKRLGFSQADKVLNITAPVILPLVTILKPLMQRLVPEPQQSNEEVLEDRRVSVAKLKDDTTFANASSVFFSLDPIGREAERKLKAGETLWNLPGFKGYIQDTDTIADAEMFLHGRGVDGWVAVMGTCVKGNAPKPIGKVSLYTIHDWSLELVIKKKKKKHDCESSAQSN